MTNNSVSNSYRQPLKKILIVVCSAFLRTKFLAFTWLTKELFTTIRIKTNTAISSFFQALP